MLNHGRQSKQEPLKKERDKRREKEKKNSTKESVRQGEHVNKEAAAGKWDSSIKAQQYIEYSV